MASIKASRPTAAVLATFCESLANTEEGENARPGGGARPCEWHRSDRSYNIDRSHTQLLCPRARPRSLHHAWDGAERCSARSTWVQGDDGSTSTTHVVRPRRVAPVYLVYVPFVSLCGTRAHARSKPRCAMASIETSTTVLSGAVPEASGRGGRRAAGLLS